MHTSLGLIYLWRQLLYCTRHTKVVVCFRQWRNGGQKLLNIWCGRNEIQTHMLRRRSALKARCDITQKPSTQTTRPQEQVVRVLSLGYVSMPFMLGNATFFPSIAPLLYRASNMQNSIATLRDKLFGLVIIMKYQRLQGS